MFDKPQIHFWKVGTGDSTSIVVQKNVVLQVDLNDNAGADNDNTPIVERLVDELPKVSGKPYLDAFALTHPDQDHIKGFEDLLDQVAIGEIWFTPRVFNEYKKDLCDDAVAFQEEAMRRVKLAIDKDGDLDSGDRIRLVGYDDLLKGDEFKGFPDELLTVPGNAITELDGIDYDGEFRAFIHAPFKEDEEHDRNDTSLAMQVVLGDDPAKGGVLLFGDISYPVIRKIFDVSKENDNEDSLAWQVFLAPHHCSKSVMYQKESDDEKLKQDILDDLQAAQVGDGTIVSSSVEVPASNKKGDNPPHAKANAHYEEVAAGEFLCTHEDTGEGETLCFDSADGVLTFEGDSAYAAAAEDKVAAGVVAGRGSDEPPTDDVGFGRWH
jgi:hypothetical protein